MTCLKAEVPEEVNVRSEVIQTDEVANPQEGMGSNWSQSLHLRKWVWSHQGLLTRRLSGQLWVWALLGGGGWGEMEAWQSLVCIWIFNQTHTRPHYPTATLPPPCRLPPCMVSKWQSPRRAAQGSARLPRKLRGLQTHRTSPCSSWPSAHCTSSWGGNVVFP